MPKNEYSTGLNQCDGCKTSITDEETVEIETSQEVYCEKCIDEGENLK